MTRLLARASVASSVGLKRPHLEHKSREVLRYRALIARCGLASRAGALRRSSLRSTAGRRLRRCFSPDPETMLALEDATACNPAMAPNPRISIEVRPSFPRRPAPALEQPPQT